ncbi:MAG: alpha/beta hydrolase [Gammaproteobacteria bacterium]|nr:alpha/beta hydrolase [Gammaproteobacteria bacterium]
MDSFIHVNGGVVYLRHNTISEHQKTLLFIHGLGESGLCFKEVFDDKRFDQFNILVPDMLGYGRSSSANNGDHSFDSQVKRIWEVIEAQHVQNITVIGHSLGGDLTTLLCASDRKNLVKSYINIEGDITQYDVFISRKAVEAEQEGRFYQWFYDDFMNKQVLDEWGSKYESCRRYYASLQFCRPDAFLQNAQEIIYRNTLLPGKYKSEIGKIYLSLSPSIPCLYCYGTESVSSDTQAFLAEHKLKYEEFTGAFHWLMIDQADIFYSLLLEFISSR